MCKLTMYNFILLPPLINTNISKITGLKYILKGILNMYILERAAVILRIPQSACVCALLRIRQGRLNQSGVNNFIPPSWSALLCCWERLLLVLWLVKEEDRMGFNTFINTKGGKSRAANTEDDLRLWHTDIETHIYTHTHTERLPYCVRMIMS